MNKAFEREAYYNYNHEYSSERLRDFDNEMLKKHLVGSTKPENINRMRKKLKRELNRYHFPCSDHEDVVYWRGFENPYKKILKEHIRGRPRPENVKIFYDGSEYIESDDEDYIRADAPDPYIAESISIDMSRKQRQVEEVATVGAILTFALLLL